MRKIFLFVLLLGLFFTVSAQDAEPSSFLRAMALVPDTSTIKGNTVMVSYADYHAGIRARGVEIPADWADFEANFEGVPLLVALPNAGPANLLYTLRIAGPEYQSQLGFEFFDIAQAVEVGQPPMMTEVLIGDIDAASVEAAYMARGYSRDERYESGALLCPEAGCDSGTKVDLANRNVANPFGGELGQQHPIYVVDGVMINSRSEEQLLRFADNLEDSSGSFADMPDVQAIDAVLAEYSFVSAVQLLNPLMLGLEDPAVLLGGMMTPEQAKEILDTSDSAPLPPYTLAALAATVDAGSQYGFVMLTYTDAESAASAAAAIDSRLETMKSIRMGSSYSELYHQYGEVDAAQVVVDEANGRFVVILRIVGEQPQPDDEDARRTNSDMIYSVLVSGLYSRDLLWLAWGTGQ